MACLFMWYPVAWEITSLNVVCLNGLTRKTFKHFILLCKLLSVACVGFVNFQNLSKEYFFLFSRKTGTCEILLNVIISLWRMNWRGQIYGFEMWEVAYISRTKNQSVAKIQIKRSSKNNILVLGHVLDLLTDTRQLI